MRQRESFKQPKNVGNDENDDDDDVLSTATSDTKSKDRSHLAPR